MRGVNVTIGSEKGTFYGEWKKCGDKMKPCGRGIFELPDKLILGYTEDDQWVIKSRRVVISKKVKEFRVHTLERSREGTSIEFGEIFNEHGLLASGYF